MRKYDINAYIDGDELRGAVTRENYHRILFEVRVFINFGSTLIGYIGPGEVCLDCVMNLLSRDDNKIKSALESWVQSTQYRIGKIKSIL